MNICHCCPRHPITCSVHLVRLHCVQPRRSLVPRCILEQRPAWPERSQVACIELQGMQPWLLPACRQHDCSGNTIVEFKLLQNGAALLSGHHWLASERIPTCRRHGLGQWAPPASSQARFSVAAIPWRLFAVILEVVECRRHGLGQRGLSQDGAPESGASAAAGRL